MTDTAHDPSAPRPATIMPDSELPFLLRILPAPWRPYALLARFDRPIGWWLLFWPCLWGVALSGAAIERWPLIVWLLLGAVAMRGAGCVYNDIVDRDLDRRVERTRSRPLASGAVSLRSAWVWLLVLCAVGLIVLVQLSWPARWVALASLALVAAYPFMKRITWWPQLWLGLVFSWGALVGWVEGDVAGRMLPVLSLYAGTVLWVVGYDTIYALQDMEDDALAGIRSSALRLGPRVRSALVICYGLALAGWSGALWLVRPDWLVLVALVPAMVHLGWQVITLDPGDGGSALRRFRSNHMTGFLVALAMLTVGLSA